MMTPGPAGGLYVLIPRPAERGSVVALLDSTGKPQPGWPVALDDASCNLPAPAVDDSIRVVCAQGYDSRSRAYAFTRDGRSIAGWPAGLPSPYRARIVDDDLFVMDSVDDNALEVITAVRLAVVASDGTLRTGTRVETPDFNEQDWVPLLGPDGTGYLLTYPNTATEDTEITAFDLDGARQGWLVKVKGRPSSLAFGPNGRIYATEGREGRSRVLVFDHDGRSLPIGSEALPVAATSVYSGAGPYGGPPPPVVAEDGTTFLVSEEGGTTVYGLDATGHVMAGWPYRDTIGLQWSGDCYTSVGGTCWRSDPAVGPGDVLYLLHPPRTAKVGGSIVAIGPDARVRPGWPVELKRPGSEFRSVVVGPDGIAYALAIEPESGGRSSATILAIAPDSTVRYTTTIVEP